MHKRDKDAHDDKYMDLYDSNGNNRREDLALIVAALGAHLCWQQDCGSYGLPVSLKNSHTSGLAEDSQHTADGVGAKSSKPVAKRFSESSVAYGSDHSTCSTVTGASTSALSYQERFNRLCADEIQVKSCTKCPLHDQRTHAVYGCGPLNVEVMIVGEAPGADEDIQGVPFVGKAGQLLDRMIAAMGFQREQIYIGNVIKCRPPRNRRPFDSEIACCVRYVQRQIEYVQPKVIIAMGATALRGLLGKSGITMLRGKWMLYNATIPVMPTFHPAYLLREPSAKRLVWQDLKDVLKELNKPIPSPSR